MIISPSRRFMFIHIPKTGGTSLALAMDAKALDTDIMIGNSPKSKPIWWKGDGTGSYLWKHSTVADLHGLVTPAELDRYFKVTLVRNPWDRMVSSYFYLRTQDWAMPAVRFAKSLDFSSFLNFPAIRHTQALWNSNAYMQDAHGIERANLYIRSEHIEADIKPFEAHLGFSLGPLTRANTSERARDWRVYYSDADAALVATLSALDISRHQYKFDPS